VSVTDYTIDILLILVIFRQVRPHQLTTRALLLPLALLAAAGALYLRPVTLGGNDLVLMAFGQVLARLAVLQIRRSRVSSQPSARQGRIAAVPQHATR
jgi:hypothetical protein